MTPAYTGGIRPQAGGFLGIASPGEFPLIDDSGSSLLFNTAGGALSGSEGTGFVDRYRAKRTPEGWVTEAYGPSAAESPKSSPGAATPDHLYYFLNAGFNDFTLEPEATLQAPFGGQTVDYLRKPNGEYELLAKGSIGSSRAAEGHLITPGASHVIFTTSTQLEPEAPPTGTQAIYDRSPGGVTHVVSLLPGNVTPSQGFTEYNGASDDGRDVAFTQSDDRVRLYVRHDNTVTNEVAWANGLHVGEELTCRGNPELSPGFEWLRNGSAIPGATAGSYTVSPADVGAVLQCQAIYSDDGGDTLQTAFPPLVVMPYLGKNPPYLPAIGGTANGASVSTVHSYAEVGETITCEPGEWDGSPTYGYSWYRNGTPITGATSATYLVAAADEQAALQCRVSATNADGTSVGFSEFVPVHPSPALASAGPTHTNVTDPGSSPAVGDELSCASGTWSEEPTFSFRWLRNGTAIAGATGSTYTVASADEGTALQCLVIAATSDTVTQATSSRIVVDPQPGVMPPEISEPGFNPPGGISSSGGGSFAPGDTVFCSEGESWDGAPTFEFQWLRDGTPIGGATENSYVLTNADIGATIQCRLTAANAGGTMVVLYAGSTFGPRLVGPRFTSAAPPNLPAPGFKYAGLYGGNVFYSDNGAEVLEGEAPIGGALFSYDISNGTTTQITDVGDALFSNISRDGSHVFFVSESQIDGQGMAGAPNLYVWSRADESTKFIASVEPEDVTDTPELGGSRHGANLASWTLGQGADFLESTGLGRANTRSTPDGSVFLFETTAQLTSFDNTEAEPDICGDPSTSGDRCLEAYVYETGSGELHCISCPPGGSGPATGLVTLWDSGRLVPLFPPRNLTQDGEVAVFESTEDILPQDVNGYKDVYLWRKGVGLSLISTGQSLAKSYIYSLTPSGSDITFNTSEPLVSGDVNGETERIYDARVNGGFPPPESAVTEPCSGDSCQGSPRAAPGAPNVASSSLDGTGNVHGKLRCGKHKRRVVRHGRERCVRRHHRHRHRHHQRGSHRPTGDNSR